MVQIRVRQKLGKYRIQRRLGEGGFASVYQAYDEIQRVHVAIKVPHVARGDKVVLDDVVREVRLVARLDHPSILPIKDAGYVDGVFILVQPLGVETLADRMRRRLTPRKAMAFASQLLDAVSYAHDHRVIHCDLKPENVILFSDDRLRLTDFGIAKVALRTRSLTADGTGTIGYLAPEQAFGRPTLRSDVFALGLVFYHMCTGALPEWPYRWPPPGYERLRRRFRQPFIEFLHRALEVDERRRFKDAKQMRDVFRRVKTKALKPNPSRSPRARGRDTDTWRSTRMREFQRRFGSSFGTRARCVKCAHPIAPAMTHCPWCGTPHKRYSGHTDLPARCRRCGRGVKRDWTYCAWCYGGSIQEPTTRHYPDRRYTARCSRCRGELFSFSRYCPWCRAKVKRSWQVPGIRDRCAGCRGPVAADYWGWCPWCGRKTPPSRTTTR